MWEKACSAFLSSSSFFPFFFFLPPPPPNKKFHPQLHWEPWSVFTTGCTLSHISLTASLHWTFMQLPWPGMQTSHLCIPITFIANFSNILSLLTAFLPLLYSHFPTYSPFPPAFLQRGQWDLTCHSTCLYRILAIMQRLTLPALIPLSSSLAVSFQHHCCRLDTVDRFDFVPFSNFFQSESLLCGPRCMVSRGKCYHFLASLCRKQSTEVIHLPWIRRLTPFGVVTHRGRGESGSAVCYWRNVLFLQETCNGPRSLIHGNLFRVFGDHSCEYGVGTLL